MRSRSGRRNVRETSIPGHRGRRLPECRLDRGDRTRSPVDRRDRPRVRVDYGRLLEAHVAGGVGATAACKMVPIANASDFGVLTLDERSEVTHYAQMPVRPTPLPYDPGSALVSIGIYAFERGLLVDCLHADASDPWSSHDLPSIFAAARARQRLGRPHVPRPGNRSLEGRRRGHSRKVTVTLQ